MKIAGKVSGNYTEHIVEMNCSSKTFVDGAVVELESALVELWDGTGAILGVIDGAVASTDTTCFVHIAPKGSIITGKADTLTAIDIESGFGLGAITIAFAGGSGLVDNALIGAKLKVIACSKTPSANGQIYSVVDSESISGGYSFMSVTGNVTADFSAGDTFEWIDLEACKKTLQGLTGIELTTDRSKVNFATDWSQGDFEIIDIVNGNEFVLVTTNTNL